MIRRPPRSTLFPTRRSSDLSSIQPASRGQPVISTSWASSTVSPSRVTSRAAARRSEEHTSELQSQSNLVCRLLLEKKKKKKKRVHMYRTCNVSNYITDHLLF